MTHFPYRAPWASLRGGHPKNVWLNSRLLITLTWQATRIGLWPEVTPIIMTLFLGIILTLFFRFNLIHNEWSMAKQIE